MMSSFFGAAFWFVVTIGVLVTATLTAPAAGTRFTNVTFTSGRVPSGST